MGTVTETAKAILVAHQRRDIESCLCGWAQLGQSHAGHQVLMLVAAGLLASERAAVDCPSHRLVQHRDRRPPWCNACRRDGAGNDIPSKENAT